MWKSRFLVPALLLALAFQLVTAQSPFTSGTRVSVETNRVKVRAAPGLTGEVVGTQESNSTGTVVDASPFYADGYWWWQIDFDAGADGWAAEGDGNEIFLGAAEEPTEVRAETEPEEAVETPAGVSEVFVGNGMRLVLGSDGNGSLTYLGQTYPVKVQETENGLTGTFNARGKDLPFQGQLLDNTLTFVTDNGKLLEKKTV
jgi:hypothetical protein